MFNTITPSQIFKKKMSTSNIRYHHENSSLLNKIALDLKTESLLLNSKPKTFRKRLLDSSISTKFSSTISLLKSIPKLKDEKVLDINSLFSSLYVAKCKDIRRGPVFSLENRFVQYCITNERKLIFKNVNFT